MTTIVLRWSFLFIKHLEYPSIFLTGGIVYMLLEILWRGYSHWSMGICGGLCFLGIYIIENSRYNLPMYLKCFFCCMFITFNEFITGYIVNISFGWNVWDYSNMPYNFMGQICLIYSIFWLLLSIPALKIASVMKKHLFSVKPTLE